MAKKQTNLKSVFPSMDDVLEAFEENDEYEMMNEAEREVVSTLIGQVLEGTNHQMLISLELTKLAVEKLSSNESTADQIFKIYTQATKAVMETSPFPKLLEVLGPKNN